MGKGAKVASGVFVMLGVFAGPLLFFGLGGLLNWLLP